MFRQEIRKLYGSCYDAFTAIENLYNYILQQQDNLLRLISYRVELTKYSQEHLSKDSKELFVRLVRLKNQFLHVCRVIEVKVLHLLDGFTYALNTNNTLVAALCTRSLVEHAGTLSYLTRKSFEFLEELKFVNDYKQAIKKLEKLEDTYRSLFYGTRFFRVKGLVDVIPSPKLVKDYLGRELKGAYDVYRYLSEFVHPNFGSNILVSVGQLGEGIIVPSSEEIRKITERIIKIGGTTADYMLGKIAEFSLIGFIYLDYIFKCVKLRLPLKDVFREPELDFIGDGRSKESAILFKGAKTYIDHIRLQYRLLEKLERRSVMQKTIFDEEFLYDIHETDKGEIWFKVPRRLYDEFRTFWLDKN